MPNKLICHLGKAGSGKGYQCNLLKDQGFIEINFADALREMAWKIISWEPKDQKEYEEFKKSYIEIDACIVKECSGDPRNSDIEDYISSKNTITGRQFLENLGSTMRKIDPDFWAKRWAEKVSLSLDAGDNVCCSDCRYVNEIKIAKDIKEKYLENDWKILNLKFILCDYRSDRYEENNPHESAWLANSLVHMFGYDNLSIINFDNKFLCNLQYGFKKHYGY